MTRLVRTFGLVCIAGVIACVIGLPLGGSTVLARTGGVPDGVIVASSSGAVRTTGIGTFAPRRSARPIVDVAVTPLGRGYATLDAGGVVESYGSAPRLRGSSIPASGTAAVALVLTPDGMGGFVAYSDGSVTPLGSAPALGRAVGPRTRGGLAGVVDVALAPDGAGLWLVGRDGRVAELGSATPLDDAPASDSPVAGIAATPTGNGAWVVRENGSVVPLGDASGARGPRPSDAPRVTGIASMGALDAWVVADVSGRVEQTGSDPVPMPGKGGGIVAVDTIAAAAIVTSAGPDAPETTRIVSAGAVLGKSGDPKGRLQVTVAGAAVGGPVGLGVGNVLAVAIGTNTPNGLLRRIIALDRAADSTVVLTTEPATLSDALPRGGLALSNRLDDLDVGELDPTSEDGSVTPTSSLRTQAFAPAARTTTAAAAGAGAAGTIADPGRFEYGCPADPEEGHYELKAKPTFSFDPEIIWDANWDDDEVHVRTGLAAQGELGVELEATGAVSCAATFKLLDDLSLGKRVIFIGLLPVVVEPKLGLEAELKGSVEGAVTASASGTSTATAALVVDVDPEGNGTFDVEGSLDGHGFLQHHLEGQVEASFSLKFSLAFLLYGVVAPQVELESGLTAGFEPCETPNLKLELPAKLGVSLKPSEWLGEMLEPLENVDLEASNEFELPGSPFLLYSDHIAGLPCDNATTLPQATVDAPYATTLEVELPDGATNPSFLVAAGDALPPGLSLTSDGALSGTPTRSGIFAFGVDVTHSLGTARGRFELTVVDDTLKVLTGGLPGGVVGRQYLATLDANRAPAELVWTLAGGTLPNGITLDPAGALAGTPTEDGVFPITIRVTNPDSGDTAERLLTLTVQVDVGAGDIGLAYLQGGVAVDVDPDGGVAALLYELDSSATSAKLMLIGVGPSGTRDYAVELPFCTQCLVPTALVERSSAGGAVVAIQTDDGARVLRYGPTGAKLWESSLPSVPHDDGIVGLAVTPSGAIAVVAQDITDAHAGTLNCPAINMGASYRGSTLLELAPDGSIVRDQLFAVGATCVEVEQGLTETSVTLSVTVTAGGSFVYFGNRTKLTTTAFRMDGANEADLDLPRFVRVAAAADDGLFAVFSDQAAPCGGILVRIEGTHVEPLTASPFCTAGAAVSALSGEPGVPGSLVAVWSGASSMLERFTGASVERRTMPPDRIVLAAGAGAGGQVFTVEATPPATPTENAHVVRRVLNPDLTDLAP